jgi:hypothetical protein
MFSEKISGGDMYKGILSDNVCALCAFTRARRAEEYNIDHAKVFDLRVQRALLLKQSDEYKNEA